MSLFCISIINFLDSQFDWFLSTNRNRNSNWIFVIYTQCVLHTQHTSIQIIHAWCYLSSSFFSFSFSQLSISSITLINMGKSVHTLCIKRNTADREPKKKKQRRNNCQWRNNKSVCALNYVSEFESMTHSIWVFFTVIWSPNKEKRIVSHLDWNVLLEWNYAKWMRLGQKN